MAENGSSRQSENEIQQAENKQAQITPIEPIHSSSDRTETAAPVPSPPSDSSESSTGMAELSTEQQEMVFEFIQATKETVSTAIQALRESEWDLLDAISRFGEDVEQEDEDDPDSSTLVITPIRPPSAPRPARRSRDIDRPTLHFQALYNTTIANGKDFPRSIRSLLFHPISLSYSVSTDDAPRAPTFDSLYEEKMWYTGFIRPWERFKDEVLDQWMNERYLEALEETRRAMAEKKFFNTSIVVVHDKPELFENDFDDYAVMPTLAAVNTLLETESSQKWTRTRYCGMGNAEQEDIASEDCVWAPRYVIKFKNFGEKSETRLIGHIEFLGGHSGALSEAYKLRESGKWGSLRCVLGDIAQWMLMSNHRYSFLVSSDEIMFLRMHIKEVKPDSAKKDLKRTTVLCEPWLYCSEPMKIADTFSPEKRTISARMGLFHMCWLVLQTDRMWRLPDEMGNCLNYAMFTSDGEDLRMRPPHVPEP